MSKFLYVFLFLAAPFFTSPGHAMGDDWFVDGKYEHQGTVFPRAVCTYKKEKNQMGFIRHSPQKTGILTPATVEFISPDAVLHDKYFERQTSELAIQSFYVTSNPTKLTKDSEDLTSLSTACYGSIPIRISTAKNLDLLIFQNDEVVGKEDYAQTMAGALEIILSEYIPTLQKAGRLSGLKTVTITDSNNSIATTFQQKVSRISSFKLESYLPMVGPEAFFWNMVFRINDQ
ncbi:MAG: hypothetical protein K2X02_04065 [Alphaproteobacteria bacterium]|nr:hypothetical protein [Alphaproteobacteria bacterium]